MFSTHTTYVLVAFGLLSLLILGANRLIVEKTTVMLDSESAITSISIAQAMVDEIQTKEFDENSISTRIYVTSHMTAVSSLGTEAGESISTPEVFPYASASAFDDIDDYNGYRRIVNTTRLGGFTVEDSVYYVTEANPNVRSSTQTFYKKIVVKVSHPSMGHPIILTDVAVYRRYL